MSQAENILNHLKVHGRITQLEALNLFGCFRLASRIHELVQDGNPIRSEKEKTRTGKTIAVYKWGQQYEMQLGEPCQT